LIEEWQHTKVDIDVENIDNDNEDKGGFNFKFPNLFKKSWSGIRQT
jgi:hypothetical protein